MPWQIQQNDANQWCVYKVIDEQSGELEAEPLVCYQQREQALAYMRALYANVEEMEARSLLDRMVMVEQAFNELVRGTSAVTLIEVFDDYVIVEDLVDKKLYRVNYQVDADTEKILFEPKENWKEVHKVYVETNQTNAQSLAEQAEVETEESHSIESIVVSEFRGGFPVVPPAAGVDLDVLTEGDQDPMFLTVPISRIGAVSKNGLLHDEEFATSLVEQINRDRPGGLMGHLREEERDTAYPTSSIHWIGAVREGDVVWAKGYIPKTKPEVREEYRIAKAKGAQVATSVYGRAVKEMVDPQKKVWRAKNFLLETIDLAPYHRSALPGTTEYAITSEMVIKSKKQGEEQNMEREQVIASLKIDELPDSLKERVAEQIRQELQERIAELVGERDGLNKKVAELETENEKLMQRLSELEEEKRIREEQESKRQFDLALSAKISELIKWDNLDESSQKGLEFLRNQFKRAVLAELNSDRSAEAVERVVKELWENEFSSFAEFIRDSLAGPTALVRGKAKVDGWQVDDSAEAIAAARAKFGI